jgi:class 3 adenylate cyclase
LRALGAEKSEVDPSKTRGPLRAERENFRAALEWAQQAEEIETVARLAAPLTRIWGEEEGSLSEVDRWLGVARERAEEYPLAVQAMVLSAARTLAHARGAHEECADLCEQALAVYRELGDIDGIVRETSWGGLVEALELGNLPRGRAMMEDALELVRAHELTSWLPFTLGNLVNHYMAEGRLDDARALGEEAVAVAAGVDANEGMVGRINLAQIANLERRYADAAKLAREALEMGVALGHRSFTAAAALRLAWSLAELQQPERAARLLGAVLEFRQHTGIALQWDDTLSERAVRDALGARLDQPTVQALVADGRKISLERAVQRELELGGEDHTPAAGDADAIVDQAEGLRSGVGPAARSARMLATVLFTDIAGSTERAAELGDQRWRDLLTQHRYAVRLVLNRYGGREIVTTGDGFLASFDAPARAIHCAREIRESVRPLGLEIRAGLHTGEVELIGDDLGGIAVHIGARVSAIAHPGEVLVTRTVVDLVSGSGIEFEDRGEHELKGVPGAWGLAAVKR